MEENREAFSGADNALPEESDKEKTKKTVRKRKPAKTGDTAPEKNTAIRKSSKAEKTDKVAAAEKGIPDEAESVSSISENTEDIANALKDTSSRDETAGRKKKNPANAGFLIFFRFGINYVSVKFFYAVDKGCKVLLRDVDTRDDGPLRVLLRKDV